LVLFAFTVLLAGCAIFVHCNCGGLPVADAGGPYTTNVGQSTTLDGSKSTAPSGRTITAYAWSFGDGSSGTGVQPTHAYAVAGTHTITLRVTDSKGEVSNPQGFATVTVIPLPVADPGGPHAATFGQPIQFDGSKSTAPTGQQLTYLWDFGDHTSGNGVRPTHTYASAGTYTATLTVTDNTGGVNSATVQVSILVASTSLVALANPSSVTFGSPTTLTGRVTPSTATGTIVFRDTATNTVVGTATLVSGSASLTGALLGQPGDHQITATYSGDSNFSASTSGPITVTVSKIVQTITFPALPSSVVYGAGPITLTGTASSGLPVSYTVTSGPATVNGSTLTITGAGMVSVTASQAGDTTHALATSVTQMLTVTKASVTVTANNLSLVAGSTIPTLTGTLAGLVIGDTFNETYTTTASPSSVPGTYPIMPAPLPPSLLANYSAVLNNGILTITAIPQTITFPALPSSVVYGASPLTLKATTSSGLPVSYFVASGPATVSGSTLTITGAGMVSVMASQAGDTTHALATSVTQTLVVTKAPLVVTANSLSSPVGSSTPTLTGTLVGVVNGDSITASYSTTATASSPPGTYPITPALVDPNNHLSNYSIMSNSGTLTITLVPQAITFPVLPSSVVYGTAPISLTATATSGLPVSYTVTSGPATLNGSTLTITGAGMVSVTASQAGDTTHAPATSVTQTLTVTKAPLTVTANNLSLAVGSSIPTLTGSLVGVVKGDLITASYSTTATASSPPGTYPISPSLVDPNNRLSNYSVTVSNGILTITLTSQTITFPALPSSVVYGAAPITLMATASSGLPVSYTVTSGPATVNGSTLTITGAGMVSVTASQAGDTTHARATSVTQTFTVTKALLTITANNLSLAVGSSIPILTGTLAGVVNGDGITASYSTTATASSPPGTYPITPVVGPANLLINYTIITTSGALILSANTQSITFPAIASVVYGTVPLTLNATASSGLPVSYQVVSGPATVNGSTLTITGAGLVSVTASQPGDATHATATPVAQTLIVTKAPLTVTANNLSLPAGSTIPTLTGALIGVVNGDAITATYTTTATASSPPGTYVIVPVAGPANLLANYMVITVNGTLILNATSSGPASVSYTYDSQGRLSTATYTTPTGTVTITYSYDSAGNRTSVVTQ